ncbi:MAG: hypothetical protein H6719_27035 [Sandaracinaceae bacterium]|nr:hypothetical protein [Sandaracinaceae bacterium]
MKVEIPQRDAPHWAGVAGVGALALAVGVAIASWGTTRDGRGTASTDAPAPASTEPANAPPAEDEPEADPPEEVPEPEAQAELEQPDPEVEAPPVEPTEVEPTETDETDETEPPEAVEPPASPPPATPRTPGRLAVRRGRIAYLRCDVASGRDCARDEPMEQAVWTALEGLVGCASGPRAPGHADLRLDYRGDAAPIVEWRDTYGDEVARLDRDAVLGCLTSSLAATRRTIATERLLVSFRFSLE